MELSRRDLIKLGGLGTLATAGVLVPLSGGVASKGISTLLAANFPKPWAATFIRPPLLPVRDSWVDGDGRTVNAYSVREEMSSADIVPGLSTPVQGYNGLVPGPTIAVEAGTVTQLRVRNKLAHNHADHSDGTSTHLHGNASLPEYDGYAADLTPPGYYKDYYYTNLQAARTMWYHDHSMHTTAPMVYSGLAAQYHVHDPVERALLPQGEFDVPLTVSDAMFARDGSLAFNDRSHSGLWGDIVLVNGRPWPRMQVKRRIYRFRFLNASLSRSYRPFLSSGQPVYMVATDGGLMPNAQKVFRWRHAPAERYEFLVDFSLYPVGTQVRLMNASNPNNVDYDHTNKIMAFDVVGDEVDVSDPTWNTIPTTLAPSDVMRLTATQAKRTVRFRIGRDNVTNIWNINDQTWQDVVDSDYTLNLSRPDLGDVEIWEIENRGGGWFHPLHIHLIDFKVLSRNGGAPFNYERGPKDVVYIGADETVRLIMRFGPHRGRYMVHCHNLPHEDHDMMTQFSVGLNDGLPDLHDPITAAPAVWDDLDEEG